MDKFRFMFWYEGPNGLEQTEYQATDENHAWEQYHAILGDEAPQVRLVLRVDLGMKVFTCYQE